MLVVDGDSPECKLSGEMSLTVGAAQHLSNRIARREEDDKMAFITGCHGANEYDDYDGDDDDDDNNDIDIADQPTQPVPQLLAALAIASAQMQLLAEREVEAAEITLPAFPKAWLGEQVYSTGRRSVCTLCAMDLEEKMRSFLITDGALLLICDYHIEQIRHAKDDDETLELYANILHIANLRYSWPPGEGL